MFDPRTASLTDSNLLSTLSLHEEVKREVLVSILDQTSWLEADATTVHRTIDQMISKLHWRFTFPSERLMLAVVMLLHLRSPAQTNAILEACSKRGEARPVLDGICDLMRILQGLCCSFSLASDQFIVVANTSWIPAGITDQFVAKALVQLTSNYLYQTAPCIAALVFHEGVSLFGFRFRHADQQTETAVEHLTGLCVQLMVAARAVDALAHQASAQQNAKGRRAR